MSRIVKIILIAAGSLAALIVIAAVIAVILFPAERVRTLIEERGAEALGMPVGVEDIGLSFRGVPSVRVAGLVIGPARAGEPPLVTLRSVNVRVALLKLIYREVEIVSLDIEQPEITMITREDDTTNLPGGETPPREGTPAGPPQLPIPITLKSLSVDNGRVELVNRADSTRIVLAGIDAAMSLVIPRDLAAIRSSGETSIDSLAFHPAQGVPIGGITATFTHEITGDAAQGNIDLTDGLLTINGLPVRVTGGMAGWTAYTFAAETGDIGFDTALAALPAGMIPDQDKLRADGGFSFTVSGSLDTAREEPLPEFSGAIAFNGSGISYAGLPKSIDEASGNIAFTQERIDIAGISVRAGNSSIAAGGSITGYMGERPTVDLASTGDLNLDDITGAVPLPEGITATGGVTYDITLAGTPADPSSFTAGGSISLNALSATMPELLKHPAELDGAMTLTPGALRIDRISFASGVSDASFEGQLANYPALAGLAGGDARFQGTLSSGMLDLNDLLVTPEKQPEAAAKPWDLEQTVQNLPVPPNFAADVTVAAGPVIFGRLKADSARARLTLEQGVLRLTGLDAAAYDGSIAGSTTVDFSDIGNVTYEGSYAVKSLESARFIADFFGTEEIMSGTLSSNLTFSGAGLDSVSMLDNLLANGDMSFLDGSIHSWDFTRKLGERVSFLDFDTIDFSSITNSFRVEDRTFYTPDMAIKASVGDIRANGSVGFDTALDYTFTLILTEAASKRAVESLSDLASIFSGDTGRLEFAIDASGTIRSPSFTLDTSAARRQLQQRLSDRVKEEAEKLLENQGEELKEKGKDLLDRLFR